jgi:2-polyprenyl-3-methyl-5-hydroxy-6-metoxy-1,4-benzoquinol methylase
MELKKPATPLHLGKIEMIQKHEWIIERLAAKSVLHIGPTDSPCTRSHARLGRLLHADIQGKCRELIGLDLDREAIEIMRQECGITDTQYGNAEQLDQIFPAQRFDVILAADVVEHMNNVGLFLEAAKKVLSPGGKLIMTLPNSFSLKRLMGAVLLRQERNNPDHMYFFSTMTLQQAAYRFGYELTEVAGFMYYAPEGGNRTVTRLAESLIRILRNNYLADELAVVMVPVD